MKTYVPNYYKSFKCIADKCKHNCCISWEIDIDEDTYEYYQSIGGRFGQRLKKDIILNDDCACFRLDGKERCAFLNKNNLCDIILKLGEDALCQICSDHPRFRNYYDNAVEIGLGLCCEEAGRLILGQNEKFKLVILDEGSDNSCEDEFLKLKESIFVELQNENHSLKEKVSTLLNKNNIEINKKDFNEWVDYFILLERLDDNWTNLLHDLKVTNFDNAFLTTDFDKIFEKLLLYFIYRHLDEMNESKIEFAVFSVFFISQICRYHVVKYGNLQFEDIVEYARMYSSEIEYSDENIEKIIEKL